jgi:pSer/pThr/pTyr-binding forkhead associated (FHA) protein/S1-C subfamily serine protease
MPFLRLRNERSGEIHEFACTEVGVGRDPGLQLSMADEGRKVVSAHHARLFHRDNGWWIEDSGSRNGTFLDDQRLAARSPRPVTPGGIIRLGRTGPRYSVQAVTEARSSTTLLEGDVPVSPSAPTVPLEVVTADPASIAEPPKRGPRLVLFAESTGERMEAHGPRTRIGRAKECELRPVADNDTSISRMHAEIEWRRDGSLVVRDLGSRNGTYVNGTRVDDEHPLKLGDRLSLGPTGPTFLIEELQEMVAAVPPSSRGSKRGTLFFQNLIEESNRKTRARIRWIVWTFVFLLAGAVGVMYWISEQKVRETTARLEEQSRLLAEQGAVADSLRRAAADEYERLREELEQARQSAAPATVLDSLRDALTEARQRTDALEVNLLQAQESLNRQLAVGDSLQRAAQQELLRVRSELNRAVGSRESAALLDSLRQAVRLAEEQAGDMEARLRAVKGSDLSAVIQANTDAVGLVTAFFRSGQFEGSGFVLAPSGHYVTNRHVVVLDGQWPDSVYVIMNEQRRRLRADVINVGAPDGPDLAVLRIRDYSGPYVRSVDWTGHKMELGEPAALIGFPAGMAMALDEDLTVRVSVNAGIFSKVESERVQFDGFTISGSSGSPIFNADGDVVAVHRAGLKDAVGMGFAVKIGLLIPLLPSQVKAELGLP